MQLSEKKINLLRHNARSVVRELGLLNDAYFDIGVTLAERHLLIELSSITSPTMGEIAERLLLDKSTVSRLIAKALKKGYIRCTTDKKDKRKRFLTLTDKGKETLNAFEPIAFNQTKNALLALNEDERELICQGVALYAKGLRDSRLQKRELQHQTIKSCPIVEMGHFTLKPFTQKDENALYVIFKEVVDSGAEFPYECNSVQEFHRQFFAPLSHVYVCHSPAGEVIGGFFIKPNYSGRSNHIANAAYMITRKYRGQGIGTLMVKASLKLAKDLGFQAMQYNMVLSKNVGAIHLYKKLGFTIVGTIPQAVRNPDNTYQDGYIMHIGLL